MGIYRIGNEIAFPYPELSEEDGLLAVGGDLSIERLLLAYTNGIFPWYNEGPILWWATKPRFVLFPDKVNISRSMQKELRRNQFQVTFNEDFKGVIAGCRECRLQEGTWISEELLEAYVRLFHAGFAASVEVYKEERLVGGVYGVKIGRCFFGESMFARESNASKIGLIHLCRKLAAEGCLVMDCQVHTSHLESMGAEFISWEEFRALLAKGCDDMP